MKVFEIPIYALKKQSLTKRYLNYANKWHSHNPSSSEEFANASIAIATYPQRLWDYNHIVGYITISVDAQDDCFNIFLPAEQRERYRWQSKRKIFLYNIQVPGTHFYVYDKMSNRDIQNRVKDMLYGIIKERIPRRYFTDTEAFDTLNEMVDYKSILERNHVHGPHEI